MYESIFKRVEEKYILTLEQWNLLFQKINKYIEKDKFPKSTICNIYFDTEDNKLIINSLEKPIYKEKVRLRSYNIPNLDDNVFLEIKSKYKGTVGKRRIKLKLSEFYRYLYNNNVPCDEQIMKELDYLFKYYKLIPSYFIAYDRKSYRGCLEKDLRITIDSNLRSRKEDLKLELGDAGKKYFDSDKCIMEIKTLGAMPLWLVRNLSELQIYPVSFSKYGSIYKKQKEEMYAK